MIYSPNYHLYQPASAIVLSSQQQKKDHGSHSIPIRIHLYLPFAPWFLSQEKDIVSYVGGFVLFHCHVLFAKNERCLYLVNKFFSDSEPITDFIKLKTRGGLCEPTGKMIDFFVLCEQIFRLLYLLALVYKLHPDFRVKNWY